ILFQKPIPPRQHRPALDERLEMICLKAMAREPKDRYAGGREFAEALTAWAETAAWLVYAPLSPGPPRVKTWLFVVVAVSLFSAPAYPSTFTSCQVANALRCDPSPALGAGRTTRIVFSAQVM